jgi:peptidase E
MALILAGGGDAKQSTKVDDFYRSLNPGRKTIACVPQAIIPAERAWEKAEKCLLERPALDGFDAYTIEDLANVEADDLKKSCHSIFMMGGNTFTLLSCIKAAGFDSKLKTVLNDVPIYGISAGAITLGHEVLLQLFDVGGATG